MPSSTAFFQSSGACWLQPGWGNSRGYSRVTSLQMPPFSSTSSSLTAEVPRSIPM